LRIDSIVNKVSAKGGYIILDNHTYILPNDAQFVFMKELATKYKNHPNVLFDLLNEPKDCTWSQWKNGGTVVGTYPNGTQVTITSKGMQALLDTVRATGAKNVVIVGGIGWASDLSGIMNGYALDDNNGNGIIYSSHIYPWHNNRSALVEPVLSQYPVIIGEMGQDSTHATPAGYASWTSWMLDWIERNEMHVTAWDFHPEAGPCLIKDFITYAPTEWFGIYFRNYLKNPASFIVDRPSPSQSSTDFNKPANLALDNDQNTFTHTAETSNPWWYYDIGELKHIQSIEIYNRHNCCSERLSNYKLFVSEKSFANDNPTMTENSADVWTYTGGNMTNIIMDNVIVNKQGRYIKIQLIGANRILSLGEVKFNFGVLNNQPPTNITLSATSIAENLATGTTVGTFSTTDPDAGNTFTYTLVTGGTDNASFTINGNTLRTNAVFDFETKSTYSIRVRTTDQGGLFFERTFTITVTDVEETTYWDFATDLEGWNTPNNLTATVNSSIATFAITASDPYIHSPNNFNLLASEYNYVIIRMQNQTGASTAELFWTTTTDGAFNGTKRVGIPIVPNDTKQRYYIVDLSNNPHWTGTIKQIRFDPTTAASGTVRLDFIKLTGAYPSAPAAIPGVIEAENFNVWRPR
jgi:hypothetical protein